MLTIDRHRPDLTSSLKNRIWGEYTSEIDALLILHMTRIYLYVRYNSRSLIQRLTFLRDSYHPSISLNPTALRVTLTTLTSFTLQSFHQGASTSFFILLFFFSNYILLFLIFSTPLFTFLFILQNFFFFFFHTCDLSIIVTDYPLPLSFIFSVFFFFSLIILSL